MYEDLATKFFEHFVMITEGINASGLWDPTDGFFYDQLVAADGTRTPLQVKSLVGVIPVLAAIEVPAARPCPELGCASASRTSSPAEGLDEANLDACGFIQRIPDRDTVLLSTVDPERLRRVLTEVLDEDGMLSPYGIRSLSAAPGRTVHGRGRRPGLRRRLRAGRVADRDVRRQLQLARPDLVPRQLPGDRGAGALPPLPRRRLHGGVPHRLRAQLHLGEVADELRTRLISLFLPGPDGLPSFGEIERFHTDPRWSDGISFYEYFDGDTRLRSRRLPPDRLDGARRGPDPAATVSRVMMEA